MMKQNENGLAPIKRALLSVSDKAGLIEFALGLSRLGIELVSTGGTARALREAGMVVGNVSDITGVPEMMEGRLKTLHPQIHGALLAVRDNAAHVQAMAEHGIQPIDLVVVNLYPFEQTIARGNVNVHEAIEQIDIGGPAMIRSAAKNWRHVAVVVSPSLYKDVLREIIHNAGALTTETRAALARDAFKRTAAYDNAISSFFGIMLPREGPRPEESALKTERGPDDRVNATLATELEIKLTKLLDLRYGENPQQSAALYKSGEENGIAFAQLICGKEMSFNNYVDADAAWDIVCQFKELACAIVKHTNPSGVGLGTSAEEAYSRALETDPISAFGGIVAFNSTVSAAAARAIMKVFTEVVVAPDFEPAAVEILSSKKNLRLLKVGPCSGARGLQFRQISGGMLVQTRDAHDLRASDLKVVTERPPSDEETSALLFAWSVCKHTKSNAIVYARNGQTIGVGAGQMSRIDAVKLGAMRARLPLSGTVLASDAFFPFRDGVDEAAKNGVSAIIQPGGSVRDKEVIAAADEHGMAMAFTGLRNFKH